MPSSFKALVVGTCSAHHNTTVISRCHRDLDMQTADISQVTHPTKQQPNSLPFQPIPSTFRFLLSLVLFCRSLQAVCLIVGTTEPLRDAISRKPMPICSNDSLQHLPSNSAPSVHAPSNCKMLVQVNNGHISGNDMCKVPHCIFVAIFTASWKKLIPQYQWQI